MRFVVVLIPSQLIDKCEKRFDKHTVKLKLIYAQRRNTQLNKFNNNYDII